MLFLCTHKDYFKSFMYKKCQCHLAHIRITHALIIIVACCKLFNNYLMGFYWYYMCRLIYPYKGHRGSPSTCMQYRHIFCILRFYVLISLQRYRYSCGEMGVYSIYNPGGSTSLYRYRLNLSSQ